MSGNAVKAIARAVSITDRVSYVSLPEGASSAAGRDAPRRHCFSIDDDPRFHYWNFFLDFGPLNLSQLYRFCALLNGKLRSEKLRGRAIYFCSGAQPQQRANAVFLVAAWSLLFLERSAEESWAPFRALSPELPPFHDASPCACSFSLSVLDCLRGLAKARQNRLFDLAAFDPDEYEHFEQVEHGDLNWIVRGKFLAFAGPHPSAELTQDGYRTLTPEAYFPYFKRHDVRLVIRLNKRCYDEQRFARAGIRVLDLYFVDGGVPSPRLLERFLQACESAEGAIAVHCKAGLGRTGTCIGAYLMKHYRMTAAEAIGWLRLCRPGSVIGPQQHYLRDLEGALWREGNIFAAAAAGAAAATAGSSGGYSVTAVAAAAGTPSAAPAAAAAAAASARSGPATRGTRMAAVARVEGAAVGATGAAAHTRRQSRERRDFSLGAAAGAGAGAGRRSSLGSRTDGSEPRLTARQAVLALEAAADLSRGSAAVALAEHVYGYGSSRRSSGGSRGEAQAALSLSQGDLLRLRRFQREQIAVRHGY